MLEVRPAPLVVNWSRVLDQVRGAGFTMSEVEAFTGIPRSTLLGYQNLGHEPRHSSGIVLLRFWAEATKADVNDPPMMPRSRLSSRIYRQS
jgi:hypothetical protein